MRRGEGDILIDNPPFGRIYHAAVIESTGRFLYDLPAMTERAGAVALAISRDGKVALMHHWRPLPAKDPSQSASFLTIGAARGVWSLEVPRGFPNGAEDCGDTARREAQEELGVVVSNVVHLGFCNFNTSVLLSDIPIYAVLAHPDRPASNKRDESEVIRRVAWMSFQEAFACVARGEVRCGLTLAALSHLVASKQKIDDLILTCDVN